MQYLSFMVQDMHGQSLQNFTERYVASRMLLEGLKEMALLHSDEKNDEGEKVQNIVAPIDIIRLDWIFENTNENIMVPFSDLDRCVNPSKGAFKSIDNKRKFKRNDAKTRTEDGKDEYITLTENQMQYWLVKSIMEIQLIVVKNVMYYNEEYPMEFESGDAFDVKGYLGGKQDGSKKEKDKKSSK